MKNPGATMAIRTERMRRRRVVADKIETAMVLALAALAVIKGGPAVILIALAIGEMMWAVARVLAS